VESGIEVQLGEDGGGSTVVWILIQICCMINCHLSVSNTFIFMQYLFALAAYTDV